MQQETPRQNKKSYRKDVRIPSEIWDQIKDQTNVSKYIIDAISEKLERENGNTGNSNGTDK